MDALVTKVVEALREKLLAPADRLATILSALAERRTERAAAINERLIGLQQKADATREKLDQLYKLVEDGAELDDVLRYRIGIVRSDHERATTALERGRVQASNDDAIDPVRITAFSNLLTGVLASAENPARKAWLRSLLSKVEVDADRIRIVGSKDVLNAAVAASGKTGENVQKCVPKWRAGQDKSANTYCIEINR
ncbi:hypothetical protein [Pelagibacterium sp.]|uniref:hypothetical protein n=1 Tax=Pelagibacterium sp. TaxID=1967288 RepID=UPI003BACE3DF